MRACVQMFGPKRGQEIHEMVTEAVGLCPCLDGRQCPIVSRGEPAAPVMLSLSTA